MSKWRKEYERARNNRRNVRFETLLGIIERAGFVRKGGKGSHAAFHHPECDAFVVLQKCRDGKAKPYQLEQVIAAIEANNLEVK